MIPIKSFSKLLAALTTCIALTSSATPSESATESTQSTRPLQESSIDTLDPDTELGDDTFLTLQRRPGMGGGPYYDVTLYGTGRIEFKGDKRNCVQHAQSHIDTSQARKLVARALLLTTNPSSDPGAGWYDGPSAKLIIHHDGKENFYGNLMQVEDVFKLMKKIDEVAETKKWIGPKWHPGHTACGNAVTYPTFGAFLSENALFGYLRSAIKSSSADINGDGLTDWTGVIISNPAWVTLHVLTQNKDGSYTVDGQSPTFEFSCGDQINTIEKVQVTGKGRFNIEMKLPEACGSVLRRYYFSKDQVDWRLTELQISIPDSCNQGTSENLDINYLSGQTLIKLRKGKKNQAIRSTASYPAWYLRDFVCYIDYGAKALLEKRHTIP